MNKEIAVWVGDGEDFVVRRIDRCLGVSNAGLSRQKSMRNTKDQELCDPVISIGIGRLLLSALIADLSNKRFFYLRKFCEIGGSEEPFEGTGESP